MVELLVAKGGGPAAPGRFDLRQAVVEVLVTMPQGGGGAPQASRSGDPTPEASHRLRVRDAQCTLRLAERRAIGSVLARVERLSPFDFAEDRLRAKPGTKHSRHPPGHPRVKPGVGPGYSLPPRPDAWKKNRQRHRARASGASAAGPGESGGRKACRPGGGRRSSAPRDRTRNESIALRPASG